MPNGHNNPHRDCKRQREIPKLIQHKERRDGDREAKNGPKVICHGMARRDQRTNRFLIPEKLAARIAPPQAPPISSPTPPLAAQSRLMPPTTHVRKKMNARPISAPYAAIRSVGHFAGFIVVFPSGHAIVPACRLRSNSGPMPLRVACGNGNVLEPH